MLKTSDIILTALPSTGFDLIIFYIKLTVAYTKNTNLMATFSLLFFLNTLFCHTQTESMIETHGIHGAIANGKREFKLMKRILMQSIIILLVIFMIFSLPSIFFLKYILNFAGMSEDIEDLFDSVSNAYLWMIIVLPGKIINENLKVYIQNEESELSVKLGFCHIFIFVLMIPVTILVFLHWEFKEMGYPLIIGIYEGLSISCCLYFIFFGMKEKIFVKVEDYYVGYKEYFKEFLLNLVWIAPMYLIFEGNTLILAYFGNKEEIAVLGFFISIGGVIFTMSTGFLVVSRTSINNLIGEKRYQEILEKFHYFERIGFYTIGGLILTQVLGHFLFLKFGFYDEGEFSEILGKSFIFFSVFFSINFNNNYYDSFLRSFGQHWLLNWGILSSLSELGLAFIFGIYFNYRLVGFGANMTLSVIIKMWTSRSAITVACWRIIEEKVKKERRNYLVE